MPAPKNIIFDLCGPIITIDIHRIDVALQALGAPMDEPYLFLYRNGVTKRFESGEMSEQDFYSEVRSLLNIKASDLDIADAWNSLIVDFDLRRVDLIQRLHQSHRTFLLSNSDVVNARHFHHYLNLHAGFPFLEECFDEYYFSYRIGLRKPSPDIFRRIVEDHHLLPQETLVVDDCLKHCQGARSAGLQAHHLALPETLLDLEL